MTIEENIQTDLQYLKRQTEFWFSKMNEGVNSEQCSMEQYSIYIKCYAQIKITEFAIKNWLRINGEAEIYLKKAYSNIPKDEANLCLRQYVQLKIEQHNLEDKFVILKEYKKIILSEQEKSNNQNDCD